MKRVEAYIINYPLKADDCYDNTLTIMCYDLLTTTNVERKNIFARIY